MPKKSSSWVVCGGKVDEMAHCMRCGEGLSLSLPQSINVVIAATKSFEKDHTFCKLGAWTEPVPRTPTEWAYGRDVGVSAFTIYSVMTGMPTRMPNYDTPKDSSDFGRCSRLLTLFPEFRARMADIPKRFPKWLQLVNNWDELESLFAIGLKNGRSDAAGLLYSRIKQLNGDNPPNDSAKEEQHYQANGTIPPVLVPAA